MHKGLKLMALSGAFLLFGLGCDAGVLSTSVEQPAWKEGEQAEMTIHIENGTNKTQVLDWIEYDSLFMESAWIVVSDPQESDVVFLPNEGSQRSIYGETIDGGDSLDIVVTVELMEDDAENGTVSICFEEALCQLHEIEFLLNRE